jgi:hypothetical protein
MYVSGVSESSTAAYVLVCTTRLVNGALILEQPSLKALTIVDTLSNRRSSHVEEGVDEVGEVTEEMTRNVVRSKRTTSEAEVTVRKWARWERREERDGMRFLMTTDHACQLSHQFHSR